MFGFARRGKVLLTKENAMTTIDETKLNDFIGKAVGDIGATLSSILVVIGDRLGLWKAMVDAPVTSAELAIHESMALAMVLAQPGGVCGRQIAQIRFPVGKWVSRSGQRRLDGAWVADSR